MPPYLLLLLLLGAVYGVLFHLWRGKTLRDLIIYLLTGIIGVGLGQAIGNLIDTGILMVGPLHLVEATFAGWLSLFIMDWLKVGPRREDEKNKT
jgi:uncharacterized membrane protein YfcA